MLGAPTTTLTAVMSVCVCVCVCEGSILSLGDWLRLTVFCVYVFGSPLWRRWFSLIAQSKNHCKRARDSEAKQREQYEVFYMFTHPQVFQEPISQSVSYDFPFYEFLYLAAEASHRLFIAFCSWPSQDIILHVCWHSSVLTLLEAIFRMSACLCFQTCAENHKCLLKDHCSTTGFLRFLHLNFWVLSAAFSLSASSALQYTPSHTPKTLKGTVCEFKINPKVNAKQIFH